MSSRGERELSEGPYDARELSMQYAGAISLPTLKVVHSHRTETAGRRKVPHPAFAGFGMTSLFFNTTVPI